MRQLIFSFVCLPLMFLVSCKKESNVVSNQTAAIQVINGAVNTSIMIKMNDRLNLSGILTGAVSKVGFGSNAFFFSEGKTTAVDIMSGVDTSLLKSNTFDFKKQGVYTLLVAGQVPAIDAVLIEETNYPFIKITEIPADADSVINIRFVNLAPDVSELDVRLSGSATNEVTALPFKGYTAFKSFTAKKNNTNYVFQFVVGGTVKATQTLSITTTNRFRNVALVFRGLNAGSPALGVSTVNYFQ